MQQLRRHFERRPVLKAPYLVEDLDFDVNCCRDQSFAREAFYGTWEERDIILGRHDGRWNDSFLDTNWRLADGILSSPEILAVRSEL